MTADDIARAGEAIEQHYKPTIPLEEWARGKPSPIAKLFMELTNHHPKTQGRTTPAGDEIQT